MQKGLVLHNLMQITIPLWITPLVFLLPISENQAVFGVLSVGLISFAATVLPDVDHFSMWNKVKHKGLFDFIKICVRSTRHRRAFLPLHNYLAILATSLLSIVFYYLSWFYPFVFFASFFFHIFFDYIADLFMIRQQNHWNLRNWYNANSGGFSIAQQVQQGDKQKHDSGKPVRRR